MNSFIGKDKTIPLFLPFNVNLFDCIPIILLLLLIIGEPDELKSVLKLCINIYFASSHKRFEVLNDIDNSLLTYSII